MRVVVAKLECLDSASKDSPLRQRLAGFRGTMPDPTCIGIPPNKHSQLPATPTHHGSSDSFLKDPLFHRHRLYRESICGMEGDPFPHKQGRLAWPRRRRVTAETEVTSQTGYRERHF